MSRLLDIARSPLPIPMPLFAPDPPAAPPPAAPPATPPAAPPATPPAAPPADGTKPPTTALGTPPSDTPAATPADWPSDWRERAATGADGKVDAKALDRLKRFTSPVALAGSYGELEARLSAGRNPPPMPDAEKDPEGNKKWREENGIPLDATGYVLPKDVTKAMLPTDKPLLQNFTEFAAKRGAPKAVVEMGAQWYVGMMEEQATAQRELDGKASEKVDDVLRKEWGEEFKPMKAAAARFSNESIPGVRWFDARLPNDPAYGEYAGMALGNITGVVKGLAELATLKYGDTSFVGGEQAKVTTTRIAELKNIMTTDIDKWNASPALRKEYGELLGAQERAAASRSGG